MQRMTDLLFGEDGVFHIDLNGRLNSDGSKKVYVNRGGILPRQRPNPTVTPLHDHQEIEGNQWKMTVREVFHQPGYIEPYALRLETDSGTLVYSGDTGPCNSIVEISQDADVLIHMCYFISGTFTDPSRPLASSGHLEAARTAAEANVKTLVATHFTPQMDAPGVKERCLAEMAEIFKGRIIWGEDMMKISTAQSDIPHAG